MNPSLTRSPEGAGASVAETREPEANRDRPRPVQVYPNLRTLLDILNDGFETTDNSVLDLASGPNPTLFTIPPGPKVREILDATHACNEVFVGLSQDSRGCSQPSIEVGAASPGTHHFQERTKTVLEALFRHYMDCQSTHEVLLSLSDDSDDSDAVLTKAPPTLDMLLSSCLCPERWQEAQVLPSYKYATSIFSLGSSAVSYFKLVTSSTAIASE